MKIALDFYGTITKHPELFWNFVRDSRCHECVILSAVKPHNLARLKFDVQKLRLGIPLETVLFSNYNEVPELKLMACLRFGIEMLIDDREDTCKLIASAGILALQVV